MKTSPTAFCKQPQTWKTEPVTVETFTREFLKREPSPKQLEVLKRVCGTIPDQFDKTFNELVLMVGQKGGKNFTVEILVSYYLYKLSNLVKLHEYFKLDQSVEFNITNSSMVNERQAKGVFFNRIKNVIRRTIDPVTNDNWFERYAGLDLRPGGFGDIQTKTINFPARQGFGKIRMHSFDSTYTAPEGLEIFLAIMDEPSRANTPILYNNAKKLYRMYSGNIAGSFPNGLGKLCIFSYPEQETNDLTVERYKRGKDEPETFVMKATTYEFNPNRRKEDNKKAYDDDPVDALCRFECIVPGSKFGFFKPYFDKIQQCINIDLENRIKFKPSITQREVKIGKTVKVHEFTGTEIIDIQGDNKIRVWAGDPGKTKDMFIVAGGYAEFIETEKQDRTVTIRKRDQVTGEEIEEQITLSGRVIVDTIIVWKPEGEKRPVDFLDVEETLTEKILEKFPNSHSVHFDQWNSESIKQRVQQRGIECTTHQFSNQQQVRLYTVLRALIWNNMFEYLPKTQYAPDEKGADAAEELRQLMLINKNKIDHPDGGSKDIADVLAILAYYILQTEYTPQMDVSGMEQLEYSLEEYARRFLASLQYLQKHYKRIPSDKEIAQHMGITEDWIPEIREFLNDPTFHAKGLSGVAKEGY